MKLEIWSIDRLVPYVKNPRKNDKAIKRVAEAIREFGFRVPVIVRSTGDVIDGHLRLKAARYIGLENVPVIVCDDMSEAQIKMFRISVNKMAELATWDFDLLAVEIEELRALDVNIEKTGFSHAELEKLTDFDLSGISDILDNKKSGKLIVCPKCGFEHE